MKKRVVSLLLALVMAAAMLPAAFADFQYPSAYWPLHDAWEAAVPAGDPDQIISLAQQTYDLLSPYGLVEDVCLNLEPKCGQAVWACEIKGDLKGAVTWLERQRTFAQWLNDNGTNRTDTLIIIAARLNQLKSASTTAIYALTDQQGNVYSGSGAPAAGTLYGSSVTAARAGESAVLMYVTFGDSYSMEYWINYNKNVSPIFRTAAEQGGVIEVAWNFSSANTAGAQAVLAADSYIAESLSALGQLNATVLLRLGAEMNNWSDCDPATFIQAFQKVSQSAHRYSNIKMVFSPDSISHWGTDFASFYPGDQYVDWIGMSDYHRVNYAGTDGAAPVYAMSYTNAGVDAYYNRGFYDNNPLTTVAPFASFAQAHNKPMMISECGFAHRDQYSGADQTSYAVESLTKYYAYINMIYPQVKAVFHFNHTMPNEQYAFDLGSNSALSSAYSSAVAANGAFITQGQTSGKTWQPLDKVDQKTDGKLKLAVYALFPTRSAATVKYFVDDTQVFFSGQAPYYYELSTASLSAGRHTVRAEAAAGQFSLATQTYTIYVADNQVSVNELQAPASTAPATAPGSVNAVLSPQKLSVDGKAVDCEKYNIDGSNYFKLRDLAQLLNGTGSQFGVGFDAATSTVSITKGGSYTPNGTELAAGVDNAGTAQPSSQSILIDGAAHGGLTVYNIGGSNFFQLRELGNVLGFEVGYDQATNTAIVRSIQK